MPRDRDRGERRSRSRSPRRQQPHGSPRSTRPSDDSPRRRQRPDRDDDQRDATRLELRGRETSRSPGRNGGGGVKGRSRSRSRISAKKRRSRSRTRSRSRSPARKRRKSRSRSRSRSPPRRHRRDKKRSRSRSRSRSKDRGERKRSRSRSRERRKERKREKKEKKKEKKHGSSSAAQWGKYGIISELDIFTKGSEFYAWLVEERKINPETISKDQNKKEFAKYVEDFNTATLPHEKYYHMEAYERRMSALRQGEFVPPPDDTYDPQADLKAISGAHKKKVVEHESYLSKDQLQELRKVQHERIAAGKMKLLGMDVKQNMGVRMDGTMFDG